MARRSHTRASRRTEPPVLMEIRRLVESLGCGLIAGLVGTAAMTLSSTVEAKLSGRGASTTPAAAAGKVAGVVPRDSAGEQRFNTLAHWGYGTVWGVFRGALGVVGLRGPAACCTTPYTRALAASRTTICDRSPGGVVFL